VLVKYPVCKFKLPKQFNAVPYLYPEYTTGVPIGDHDVTLGVSEQNLLSSCARIIVFKGSSSSFF